MTYNTRIGIDLAKSVFPVHGELRVRQKLSWQHFSQFI